MDFFIGIWKVFFLLCSCNFCGCYKISCVGELLVDADIIPIGSTLTVQCSTYTSRCGRRFAIDFNGHTFYEETNCSRIKTQIVINQPKSRLLCRVKEEDGWHLVCGKDLTAGYPPGKPVKFSCVTHTHSEHVNCSLTITTETYLPTKYTVTFVDETTSQYFKYGMNEDGSVSIPRSVFNETVTYQAHVSEHNALGNSHSNFTFSIWDSVIPSTPEITQIVFENGSLSPIIHWKSSEEPWASLKPRLRFREANDSQHWVLGRETELHAGRVLLQEALHPLMFHQFQLRVCVTSDNCSMWSHFFNITSPGIAPSRKLDVWREIKRTNTRGRQNVTVLWKPFTSEDYRGGLLGYRLSYHEDGKIGEVNCSARATQHTFHLPLNTAEINISAVTSAGSSPPAPVSLIHTGKPAPRITYAAPAAEGGVRLVWDVSHYSEGVKILGFVVQWEHRAQQLQWKKLGKDFTSTLLEGMQAGILYNISLYTEEASGVSNPAFSQVYAKEEKPLTGPDVSVTTAGEKHILIHWIELDQDKRRGFITNYTIYLHRHKDKRLVQKKTLPHALSRSFRWELQSLQESFDVLVSAWNSAGEGPKGNAATCYYHMTLTCGETSRTYRPVTDNTTDGMVAGFCLVAAVPIVILANLMYLKCVRQRMMKICMSMGVSWLFENLPKFDNSKAIKLLKDDSYGRWGPLPGDNDPPLTPIEEISTPSWERKDSYPTVLHEDVPETPTPGQLSIDCPYKPQLLSPSQRAQDIFECSEEEMKEEEEQFPLLISPSHVLHDFNWDLTFIPVIHGPLNSFLAVDGEVGSLSALENLLSPPQTAADKDRRVKEEERTEGTGDMGQNSCQTVIPNDIESCLRAPVFGSSPYSPQGVCDSFAKPEEL